MIERLVISLLSPNRVGIFSDVVAVIADYGGNIDGLSQTVTEGYFTMLLTASFKTDDTDSQKLRNTLTIEMEKKVDAVMILPYRSKGTSESCSACRYIITLIGKDHPGLLAFVSKKLEEKNINVTDWYFEFEDTTVTHIGEILVPQEFDVDQLQDELAEDLSGMNLTCSIQHENIFKATNEIGPIKTLVEESRRA